MDAPGVMDLCRNALLSGVIIAAPLLLVGLVVGFVVSLLQAVTQVQDQTVSFVPKVLAVSVALIACMPWMLSRMLEFTREVFQNAGMP